MIKKGEVYKAVVNRYGKYTSVIDDRDLETEYEVGYWISLAYPILAFDTMENAFRFNKNNYYKIFHCLAKNITRQEKIVEPFLVTKNLAESFWNTHLIDEEFLTTAPEGTVSCESIKLLEMC